MFFVAKLDLSADATKIFLLIIYNPLPVQYILYIFAAESSSNNTIMKLLTCLLGFVLFGYQVQAMTTDTLWCEREGKKIFGILHRPAKTEGKLPLVIISHGFGGTHEWGVPYAEALTQQGFLVYCFDFCGGGNYSQSDGTTDEMSIITERDDLKAVLQRLHSLPEVDCQHITLMGESQGGIVTALAAAEVEADIHDIILFYPAFSIPVDTHRRYPTRADIPDGGEIWGVKLGRIYAEDIYDLDPYATIALFQKPVLILHGDSDRIVPIAYGERAARTYKNVEYHVLNGVDHGFYGLPQWLAIQLVQEFLVHQIH